MTGPDVFTLVLYIAAGLCALVPAALVLSEVPDRAGEAPARAVVRRHRMSEPPLYSRLALEVRTAFVVCAAIAIFLFTVAVEAVTYRPTVQIGAWS